MVFQWFLEKMNRVFVPRGMGALLMIAVTFNVVRQALFSAPVYGTVGFKSIHHAG